jgi:hypothetical protein
VLILVSLFLDVFATIFCLSVVIHNTCHSPPVISLQYTPCCSLHTNISTVLCSPTSHPPVTLLPYITLFYWIFCVQTRNPIPVLYCLCHIPLPASALVLNPYEGEICACWKRDEKMISWILVLILIYLLTAIGLTPGGSSTVEQYSGG